MNLKMILEAMALKGNEITEGPLYVKCDNPKCGIGYDLFHSSWSELVLGDLCPICKRSNREGHLMLGIENTCLVCGKIYISTEDESDYCPMCPRCSENETRGQDHYREYKECSRCGGGGCVQCEPERFIDVRILRRF